MFWLNCIFLTLVTIFMIGFVAVYLQISKIFDEEEFIE